MAPCPLASLITDKSGAPSRWRKRQGSLVLGWQQARLLAILHIVSTPAEMLCYSFSSLDGLFYKFSGHLFRIAVHSMLQVQVAIDLEMRSGKVPTGSSCITHTALPLSLTPGECCHD